MRRTVRAAGLAALLALGGVDGLAAQERSDRFQAVRPPQAPVASGAAADSSDWGFGERATLGVLGSVTGLSAGAAVAYWALVGADCEGLGCAVVPFLVGGSLGSALGTTAGIHLFGWATDTPMDFRSTLAGAAIGVVGGALVGAAAGAATGTEAGFVVGYTITQGTLAALASAQD